jgi:hypothetical protein
LNLLRFLQLLNRPCRDMTALISRSLDERLPLAERWAYKFHVLYCRACKRYLKQLREMRKALSGAAEAAAMKDGSGSDLQHRS